MVLAHEVVSGELFSEILQYMSFDKSRIFDKRKVRIVYSDLLVDMESLILSITKKTKFKAYVPVETRKMEAHQYYITIGIATLT